MDFHKFSQFIKKYQGLGQLPEKALYPKDIRLESAIWVGILNLEKFTSKFNYEHSISLFDVAETLITTPPVKGTQSRVSTRHQIEMKYLPKVRDWYEKKIYVNGKEAHSSQIKLKDIVQDPKILPLFNIHSHPSHIDAKGEKVYSFFSETDLNSLFGNSSLCMGLVTDEFLLACKSNESGNALTQDQLQVLDQVNGKYFSDKEIDVDMINKLGIVLYRGKFKKKLERVN
jgi:hypothetical protein